MAKKQVAVTLRKPPPADADGFIARAANESGRAPLRAPARPADELVTRADGHVLRELTVYLPPELARKLSLACMEKDRDVSNVLAEIITEHLGPAPAVAPAKLADPLAPLMETAQKVIAAIRQRLPHFV